MNTLRRFLTITLATLAAAGSVAMAADADVTGHWTMTVETSQGSGTPTFTLKQDGQNISGTYKGMLGEAPVAGTLKGNAISMTYKVEVQDTQLLVTYQGTVEGATMKGKILLGDFGEGTFTGKKN